jgi:HEAT repeat protein
MVVMEELIHESPELAMQVISPLWECFAEISEQARGDIVYIFGEIGRPEAAPALESVLEGKYSADVKEAAEEALSKIRDQA